MDGMGPDKQSRKRRRRRKKQTEGTKRTANWNLKEFCNDEDIPRFETKDEKPVAAPALRKPPSSSLLFLLRKREIGSGGWNASRRDEWQSQMLIRPLVDDNTRKGWRPYASRNVEFTALETPHNAAVLSIDRHGNYAMSLNDLSSDDNQQNGANDNNLDGDRQQHYPVLSLSFYGIPSKAILNSRGPLGRPPTRPISPLLQTVSLLSKAEAEYQVSSLESNGGRQNSIFMEPATILTSSDAKIGVAFRLLSTPLEYRREHESATHRVGRPAHKKGHNPLRGKDLNLGTLLIFSLPQGRNSQQQLAQSLKFPNIRVGSFAQFTMRNLLWKVDTIPFQGIVSSQEIVDHADAELDYMEHLKTSLCHSVLDRPGFLVCNDEDDGFRLIWVTDSSWRTDTEDACIRPLKSLYLPAFKDPDSPNIVLPVSCSGNETFNDPQTGTTIQAFADDKQKAPKGDLIAAYEAYLSIPNLVLNLLRGRSSLRYLFSEASEEDDGFPDFGYNLISVNNGGRTMDVVAVIKNRDRVGCVGVYVTIDLFTQQYRENCWVANKQTADGKSLRKFCNSLALNYRMRQRKLGPYSVDPDDTFSWAAYLCEEKYFYSGFDFDMERDLDPNEWLPFLDLHREVRSGKSDDDPISLLPKTIPYSSLYPDCEMASNRTISAVIPAAYLTGRKSPLKILYR